MAKKHIDHVTGTEGFDEIQKRIVEKETAARKAGGKLSADQVRDASGVLLIDLQGNLVRVSDHARAGALAKGFKVP